MSEEKTEQREKPTSDKQLLDQSKLNELEQILGKYSMTKIIRRYEPDQCTRLNRPIILNAYHANPYEGQHIKNSFVQLGLIILDENNQPYEVIFPTVTYPIQKKFKDEIKPFCLKTDSE